MKCGDNMISNDEIANKKIEDAKKDVVNAITETMDLYGVTTAAGRLYAVMQYKDQMNLDEIQKELDMRKQSMSTSVRKLQERDMMCNDYRHGSSNQSYIAEKNYFSTFISYFCLMWDSEAKMNLEAIHRAKIELNKAFEYEDVSLELMQDGRNIYNQLEESKI